MAFVNDDFDAHMSKFVDDILADDTALDDIDADIFSADSFEKMLDNLEDDDEDSFAFQENPDAPFDGLLLNDDSGFGESFPLPEDPLPHHTGNVIQFEPWTNESFPLPEGPLPHQTGSAVNHKPWKDESIPLPEDPPLHHTGSAITLEPLSFEPVEEIITTVTLITLPSKPLEALKRTVAPMAEAQGLLLTDGRFQCSICNAICKDRRAFKKHRSANHCFKQCELCLETFVGYTKYISHMRKVHKKPIKKIGRGGNH